MCFLSLKKLRALLGKRQPEAYHSGNVMLSSDPYPVSTQQQVAWLGNCWMILRYARGAEKSCDQEAGKEKKKKKLFEFIQNGLFTQPHLKMTFCCRCLDLLGQPGRPPGQPPGGAGVPWAGCLVRSWDGSLLSSACFLCCYCCCFS